jgi:hypothetical protein
MCRVQHGVTHCVATRQMPQARVKLVTPGPIETVNNHRRRALLQQCAPVNKGQGMQVAVCSMVSHIV